MPTSTADSNTDSTATSDRPTNALGSNIELPVTPAAEQPIAASPLKLLLAFAAIYIVWGTTYLAMRIAVDTMPPFLIAGSRFILSGTFLMTVLVWRGVPLPTKSQWKSAIFIGCLLIIGGNGLVMWGIQRIPSGICAVIIATMPLWMTLFDWCLYGGPKPGWKISFGLLLGLAGIVLLMGPRELLSGETRLHLPSMLAVICAPIFWSFGSLHSRKMDLPKNVFMATASEMLAGGVALIGLSLIFQEHLQFHWHDVSTQSLIAFAYLAVFGSLVAFTSYMWLLQNAPPSRVATYTYINPVIAVFLGWLVLSEPITSQTLIAITVIVSAVVIIVSMRQKKQ